MQLFSKIILKILKNELLSYLFNNKKVKILGKIKIGNYNTFSISKEALNIEIGDKFSLRNYCNILVGEKATLKIENNVFMNNYCSINCLESIEIGENTLFGEGVKLYDHNHEYTKNMEQEFKIEHQKFNTKPIVIGKNCWLGSNVTVLKGVTIGDNCIIGAGCLVYKDVEKGNVMKL